MGWGDQFFCRCISGCGCWQCPSLTLLLRRTTGAVLRPLAAPLVHSGAGHPTASPPCPTIGQRMWQPVPFLAVSLLPRTTQPKILRVSQLNQHSVITLFEERQTERQKECVSFVMVIPLSGCCFFAQFAGENRALAAPGAAAEQKGRRPFYFKHNFCVSWI